MSLAEAVGHAPHMYLAYKAAFKILGDSSMRMCANRTASLIRGPGRPGRP